MPTTPGISATSLNDRLSDLSGHGLVVRHIFAGPPMSTWYEATEAGAIVSGLLWTLAETKRSASPPPPGERASTETGGG
ncbi:winged helix-turn-helix transcriptional regulator [Streptosporangium sp. NPDC023615]|uniref:winged helix-turn-helix transcriptional regulator n=1 Tax=Streptosporangium sp. NPDC023615 TaxID=3154794 RepID=UPI00342D492B